MAGEGDFDAQIGPGPSDGRIIAERPDWRPNRLFATRVLAGWLGAANEDQRWQMCAGEAVRLITRLLNGSCCLIHWSPRFTRRTAKKSLGKESYAFSGATGRLDTLMYF